MPKTGRIPLTEPVLEATLKIWRQAGGRHLIPITGRSMLPLIQAGDHVLVAHGWASVRRGDVLVFRRAGKLIAHRVLHIHHHQSERVFITKGDNVCRFDPPVYADEIVGRVLAVERRGRQIPLNTVAWRVVGWLIAVNILIWTYLYEWGRNLKQRFLGSQPHCLTTFLHRNGLAFFSLIPKIVQTLFCRGKE